VTKGGNATLIGAFVVGGLALVLAAVIIAGGGKVFARKERAVMHFSGSIYGLQVGAPVVFRGVRLGSVTSIGLVYDAPSDTFSIPVMAELESRAIRGLGRDTDRASTPALNTLLAKGLKAQLAMQNLLTGQLYVDLDLRPDKPSPLQGADSDHIEIPTTPTPIQSLKNQLDGMDFRRLLDDISTIATSARELVAGPQLKKALDDLTEITGSARRITARLDQRLPAVTDAAQTAMVGASRAFDRLDTAADRVDGTAQRLGVAADRASALLADDSRIVRAVQTAAEELSRAATGLRQQTADDAPLMQNTGRAMQDVSRAARAVRELADLLDRDPQSLLRGRPARADEAAAPAARSSEARP